jgi:hypothetical protein
VLATQMDDTKWREDLWSLAKINKSCIFALEILVKFKGNSNIASFLTVCIRIGLGVLLFTGILVSLEYF